MTRNYIKESDFIDMMKCYNNDHYSSDERMSPTDLDEYFDKLFAEYDRIEEMHYRKKAQEEEQQEFLYEEDAAYIAAEEGRYCTYEDEDIMNYGISQIDVDEMNACTCCAKEPVHKSVANDTVYEDYITPEDIKTRGGENYHINKQKTKPHSPKSERKQKKEKRAKDRRTKESRCHRRNVAHAD
jgi:hypothetical protein